MGETRLRDHVHDRADLVAVLGGHVAVDHLHRLGDAGVDRVREGDAGLVGDGLAVDDELSLAVRALEVVAPVLVLRETGGGGDQLLHGPRGDRRRGAEDVGLVDVHVRRRGVRLELSRGFLGGHAHGFLHSSQLEGDRNLERSGRADVDRPVDRLEALDLDVDLVRVHGHVEELVRAGRVGGGLRPEAGHVVSELERHAGHGAPVGRENTSADGAGGGGCVTSEQRAEQNAGEGYGTTGNGFHDCMTPQLAMKEDPAPIPSEGHPPTGRAGRSRGASARPEEDPGAPRRGSRSGRWRGPAE